MVKGLSKRVVVVQTGDSKLFEQAIFIVKDEKLKYDEKDIMRQACDVAGRYMLESTDKKRGKIANNLLAFFCGAISMAAIWLTVALVL